MATATRELIMDAIADKAQGMSKLERDRALQAISTLKPDPNGQVGYEDAAYLLGATGNVRAAIALVRHMGPTDKELMLTPLPMQDGVAIPRLVWPGRVIVDGDLNAGTAYVGNTLEVSGNLKTRDAAWVGALDVRGEVRGVQPKVVGILAPEGREAVPVVEIKEAPKESLGELSSQLQQRIAAGLAQRAAAKAQAPQPEAKANKPAPVLDPGMVMR